MLDAAARQGVLDRFQQHREAWARNPALRALYAEWYARVAAELPPVERGIRVELGSGPGFAREFIPDLQLTDVVRAPWHDREVAAEALPFADGSVGALVLFDVLHHLPAPRLFFQEATRVLAPSGRIVLCEPFISPLSYPVYKLFHEESVDLTADPLQAQQAPADKDPFDSNQAIPTRLFGAGRARFEQAFPALKVRCVRQLAGPSYAASGGFGRGPLVPMALWSVLHAVERRLPQWAFRVVGFRMLVVIERV